MTNIMKMADEYAASAATTPAPTISARAALQSAIEALQAECAEHKENAMRNARQAVAFRAERDALDAKLDTAIQSSAHWQHQCTELQAENERLKAAFNGIDAKAHQLIDERDALKSKVDAMGKGEAIYQFKRGDGSWFDQTKASYDYNVKCGVSRLRIVYAAPKALTPLTDEQAYKSIRDWCGDLNDDDEPSTLDIVRAIEAAHGIHAAKGGQHEDA